MKNTCGMQIIMDVNGNYYREDENHQLIKANNREEASIFTFYDANQKIGGGERAMYFFTIPVENVIEKEITCSKDVKPQETVKKEEQNKIVDVKEWNWLEYLEQFCTLASQGDKRYSQVITELSEVDQEISDLLHLIELYELTPEEECHTMQILKETRQRRRDIKDEKVCLEYMQGAFLTKKNVADAKNIIGQMKKLNNRVYTPRRLPHLFKNVLGREINREEYKKKNEDNKNTNMHMQGGTVMGYIAKETIYDSRHNDWLAFAKEQLDYYCEIEQYMANLQIEVEQVESQIEQLLLLIEDAHYNVTQGYKAFKELKDLRNERKVKQQEIECLRVMLRGINCAAMKELYQEKIEKLEGMIQMEN